MLLQQGLCKGAHGVLSAAGADLASAAVPPPSGGAAAIASGSQPLCPASLQREQRELVQGAAPQPAAGGNDDSRGWLSMWRHNLALDQLFYPLAAG